MEGRGKIQSLIHPIKSITSTDKFIVQKQENNRRERGRRRCKCGNKGLPKHESDIPIYEWCQTCEDLEEERGDEMNVLLDHSWSEE